MLPLDLWGLGHHWLRWAFVLQELWSTSSYPTPILPPLQQHDPIFNSSSFPHVQLISQTLMPMPEKSEIYLQKFMWRKKSYDQTFKSLTCAFAFILDFPNLHESGQFQFSKRRDFTTSIFRILRREVSGKQWVMICCYAREELSITNDFMLSIMKWKLIIMLMWLCKCQLRIDTWIIEPLIKWRNVKYGKWVW